MNKRIEISLIVIIMVTLFLTEFHFIVFEATGNFIYFDEIDMRYHVNSMNSYNYWIGYNDGYADDAFGLTQWGVITMAIELTDTELSPYRYYIIDELNVAFGSENNPPGLIVDYEVWIENFLPSNPYCSCCNIVATGTSTGDIWNIIDVVDTAIPDNGNLFIGINIEQISGQYPCGVDQNQSGPTRAALMTYQGWGSWTDLFTFGFPGVWCLDVGVYPNSPPNTPSYLNPSNHEKNVDINDNLMWTCSDPEGDTLVYDVYFGTGSNVQLVSIDLSQTYYDPPGAMSYNTRYYWRIVAKDEFGVLATGPIWDFTTINDPNNPPYQPSNPNPSHYETNVDINTNLSWTGGDPDADDTVTYDVYFGSMLPLQKIASNISNTSIIPGNLVNGLTYYWNVIAWDNNGASTVGPSWYFTTKNIINNPPNKPCKPVGKINGIKLIQYLYTTNTTDPDGDQVYYLWDWGDDSFSTWLGPYESGGIADATNAWAEGSYNIRVKAKDIYDLESDWSDPLSVKMPKNKVVDLPLFLQRFFQRFPFLNKILSQII